MCMREVEKTPQSESKRRLSIHKGTSKEEAADRLSLLRVVDVDDHYSIDEIERLFNSRYIACAVDHQNQLHALSSISLHWNLQTLALPAPISLPSEFWQMPQLRHLKVPGITLSDPQQANATLLEHLQTLSTVKDFVFRENTLRRIPHVRKLGIDCDTTNEVESFCLHNLILLRKLESLALAFRGTWPQMKFPDSLKKLTLSHCEIPWEDMSVVGSLPNLEALKLQTDAAKGQTWNPNEGEFRRLRMLLINRCELEIWGADDTHFPCLEHLQLIAMRRMEEIPMDFAQLPALQTIELNHCRRSLSASAKRISEARGGDVQVRSIHSEDAAVESLLQNMKQVMLEHPNLIKGDEQLFQTLYTFFRRVKAGEVETDLGDIRSLINETQDEIDAYVNKMKGKHLWKIHGVDRDIGRTNNDFVNLKVDDAHVTIVKSKHIIDRPPVPSGVLSEHLRKIPGINSDICRSDNYFVNWKVDDAHVPIVKSKHIARPSRPPSQVLSELLRKIHGIYGEIGRTDNDFANLKVDDGHLQKYEVAGVRETHMVGFKDEVEILKGYLFEESQELDVVSIIGMPGLGKTTLARKIFCDPQIQDEFPTRIWIHVSQEFTMKHVFHTILKEFTTLDSGFMIRKTDEELANLTAGYLENIKFLLVIDDMRRCEDWDKLHITLPKSNRKSRVLVTSRQEEVGWHVSGQRGPHMLRFLNEDESYKLLQSEVFHETKFPPELKDEGEVIADACKGLPLAIVIVAGTLVNKFSDDMIAMGKYWETVSNSLKIYDDEDDEHPRNRFEKIILWSYEKLPDHLRDCFLYFGMFPEDFEIPVWKLIRLWIAEGFIQQKGVCSLEKTAENYLEELISRNIVRAGKFKLNGKPKTCFIHGMLRDFCLREAGTNGNHFLQEIKMSSDGGFQPPISMKSRRLCIHSNILEFISGISIPSTSVRTFGCFSRDETIVPIENELAIPLAFPLLSILDVQPIRFAKGPTLMIGVGRLRYLVLSVNLEEIPLSFSYFDNIQTLVINTSSRCLDTREYITNMLQLRHFKTNASATLLTTSKSNKGAGEKIQTLGNIAPESCTEVLFDRARNLKKLGIRGNLALLFDNKSGSFDSLRKLDNLEELKLIHDVFHIPPPTLFVRIGSDYKLRVPLPANKPPSSEVQLRVSLPANKRPSSEVQLSCLPPANKSPPSEVQVCRLPPANTFPPKLKALTLSETSLEWCHISILGFLENLEVLKLRDNAFQGEIWEATDGGFRRLQVLYIGRTNLKIWLASHHHFPRLQHLQLNNCEDLQQLPIELADVLSFQKLNLFRSKGAAASAKEIEAKMEQDNLQSGNVVRRFRLSISLHEK